jgi:hypothetical protein
MPVSTPALKTSIRLKAWGQFVAAALVALFGIAVAATAAGHALDPVHVGLWSGPNALFFGTLDDSLRAHQLPSGTLYLVALVVIVLAWKIARELYGFATASLNPRAD